MNPPLPHNGVYTRLGVSPIHGIGVFAIRDIPAGTPIFPNLSSTVVWFDTDAVRSSNPTPEEMRFYEDFCIQRDGKYGCPATFSELTAEWYLNEASEAGQENVILDEEYNLVAKRMINAGEELTIRYTSFSDR
jgi:uncharacterized protein